MTQYRQIIIPFEAWQNVAGVELPQWVVILQGKVGEGSLLISTGAGPLAIDPTDWLIYRDPTKHHVANSGVIGLFTDKQFREQFEPVTPQITIDTLTDAVLHGMGIQRITPEQFYDSAEMPINKPPVYEYIKGVNRIGEQLAPMMMIDGIDTSDIPEVSAEWFKTAKLSYRGIPLDHQEPIAEDDPRHPNQRATRFRDQLECLINEHSMESGSDIPDFILAEFLTTTLMTFDRALSRRTQWHGGKDVGGLKARVEELEAQLKVVELLRAQFGKED